MLGVVLLAGWVFMQAAPPPPGNPIVPPPQVNVTTRNVLEVPPMDPQAVSDADAVANQSFIVNTVQPVPAEWDNELCKLPNIWTTTPADLTYGSTDLQDIANLMLAVAGGLTLLAFAGAGLEVMAGADAEEKFGRLFLGSVLAVGNRVFWQIGIDLNNQINSMLAAPDVCNSLVKPHIQLAHPDPGASISEPVLVIVYAVVGLLLLLALGFRLGMVDFLLVAGPLFLFSFADEHVEHWGAWYHRIALGTLFGQTVLCIGLRVAHVTSSVGAGVGATLLTIVMLLICRNLLNVLSHQAIERRSSGTGWRMAALAARLIFKVI